MTLTRQERAELFLALADREAELQKRLEYWQEEAAKDPSCTADLGGVSDRLAALQSVISKLRIEVPRHD